MSTITIDASGATAGINFNSYLGQYYSGLSTSGSSTFYGGVADPSPYGYQNGSQVGFRWTGDASQRQVLLEGEDLAYDFAHYGSSFGHGISGTVQSVTFGAYDSETLPSDGAGGHGELQGVNAELVISGLSIAAEPGAGNNSANPVYSLYSEVRLSGGTLGLTKDGMIAALYATFDTQAQTIVGSQYGDVFDGTAFGDSFTGAKGDDVFNGLGGDDTFVLSGTRSQYDVVDNEDGTFTVTDLRGPDANEGADTVSNVETFAFADGDVAVADIAGGGQPTIAIDASGSEGIDVAAFIGGGFLADATSGGFPVFDNGSGFSGEEMFIAYGTGASAKYVLARGEIAYDFSTHTVSGTITTIEFGTRGAGSFNGDGAFVGGDAVLRMTGLDLSNAAGEQGIVHLFAAAHMAGSAYDPEDLAAFTEALDGYAQNFIGSSGEDEFGGGSLDDDISGKGGDDLFHASAGDDAINGGADDDTVDFAGNRNAFVITEVSDGVFTVERTATGDVATLRNVEHALFDDIEIELATGDETVVGGAPEDVALSDGEIDETASLGAVIGTLSATDPEGKPVAFSLNANPGNLFEIVGNELRLKGGLDFEDQDSYTVKVDATDADGSVTTQSFTIAVGDVDEAPEGLALSRTAIDEDAQVGTRVGTLTAVDPEGGPVTYALKGDAGGMFAIKGDKIVLAKGVDYEKASSHTIVVMAKDEAGHKTTQHIVIDINDVMEAMPGTARADAMRGGDGMDRMKGVGGDDTLNGRGGDDWLHGGVDDDRLTGGLGADDLRGGKGADRFILRTLADSATDPAGQDTVFDFRSSEGDRIDLSAIDAMAGAAGDDAFSFIGTGAFDGTAGQLRYEAASGGFLVSGDVDGDSVADFAVTVKSASALSAEDFVL